MRDVSVDFASKTALVSSAADAAAARAACDKALKDAGYGIESFREIGLAPSATP